MPSRLRNWSSRHALGLRLAHPFAWTVAAALMVCGVAWQWKHLTTVQQQRMDSTIVLTHYIPRVAALRNAVCETQDVVDANLALRLQAQQELRNFRHDLEVLPDDLPGRDELWRLGDEIARLSNVDHEQVAIPHQVRAVDSLFQTTVANAVDYLREEGAVTQKLAARCAWLIVIGTALGVAAAGWGYVLAFRLDRKWTRLGIAAEARVTSARQQAQRRVERSGQLPTQPAKPETRTGDVIAEFLDKLQMEMQRLNQVQQAQDFDTIAEIARWLAGAAGTFGFDQFTSPSRRLEDAALAGASDRIEDLIQQLEQLSEEISPAIAAA